jgi:hypothetical protein
MSTNCYIIRYTNSLPHEPTVVSQLWESCNQFSPVWCELLIKCTNRKAQPVGGKFFTISSGNLQRIICERQNTVKYCEVMSYFNRRRPDIEVVMDWNIALIFHNWNVWIYWLYFAFRLNFVVMAVLIWHLWSLITILFTRSLQTTVIYMEIPLHCTARIVHSC